MGIIRNFIEVIGITPEDALPKITKGQLIKYSDANTISIPKEKRDISSLYQVMIEIDIKSSRIINTSMDRTIVLDGQKKLKLLYSSDCSGKANIMEIVTPYNTFVELPKTVDSVSRIQVCVLDAYFDVIDARSLYSHVLYLVSVHYDKNEYKKSGESESLSLFDKTFDFDSIKEVSVSDLNVGVLCLATEYEFSEVDSEYI